MSLVKNCVLTEKRTLSFIELDFNFNFYPSTEGHRQEVEWIVNFWDNKKALTYNYLSLSLDMLDIANLLNYLLHVQSKGDEKYEPVTGDGLTQEQLEEKLDEAMKQVEEGKGIPAEEFFKQLKEKYGLKEPDDKTNQNGGAQ